MQDPTPEEQKEAMENMECWSTHNHLKECRECAPEKDWKHIEEEFRKKFLGGGLWDCVSTEDGDLYQSKEILDFFKPYFQEKMHEEAVEELEVVDNNLEE